MLKQAGEAASLKVVANETLPGSQAGEAELTGTG
jgi:hypothetical protein